MQYLKSDSARVTEQLPYALSFQNILFFKNNEYFTKLWPGYTLIGNSLNPLLHIRLHNRLDAVAGFHVVYFYGDSQVYYLSPVWRLRFKPNEHWTIVAGNLHSALQHNLLEPMYNPEQVFLHPQEKGLQFLYQGHSFSTDIWIDWEKFILWGDAFQEWFTQGTASTFRCVQNDRFSLQIPLQSIITHHGGQIDVADKGVETLANVAMGYSASITKNGRQWIAEQYLLGFFDLSPQKQYPFTGGRAFLSQVAIKMPRTMYSLGYWYGDYFLTAKGNPLFNQYNPANLFDIEGQRSFVLGHFEVSNNSIRQFRFTAALDVYYDIFNGFFEYSYGLYFQLNQFYSIKHKL
jgi:hypothetical protein